MYDGQANLYIIQGQGVIYESTALAGPPLAIQVKTFMLLT